jgi:hypothetical protein
MGRTYSTNEKNVYSNMILMGKQEGKRQVGNPRCMREDNIKMYLKRDRMG